LVIKYFIFFLKKKYRKAKLTYLHKAENWKELVNTFTLVVFSNTLYKL